MRNGEETETCAALLLRVVAQADSDMAVLHAGQKPYLMGPGGKRPLSHHVLSVAAMRQLVRQLLPEEKRDALARVGATRYTLPTLPNLPHEHFTITAELTPGGPVVEVSRVRVPEEDYVPPEVFSSRTSATLQTARRTAAADQRSGQ